MVDTLVQDEISLVGAALFGAQTEAKVQARPSVATMSNDELWRAIEPSIESYQRGKALEAKQVEDDWEMRLGHAI